MNTKIFSAKNTMASVYMNQASYQHQQQQHHFQNMDGGNIKMQQYAASGSRHQAIAPATGKVLGSSSLHNIQQASGLGPMLPRKKYTYTNMPYGEQLPSVARRNARERNRVKQVNNGFSNLRQHLPQTVINALSHGGRGESKKLSKVDTLRIAVEYIRGLQDLLCDSSNGMTSDESSNDGSNYGYSSVDSPIDIQQYQMPHSCHSGVSASPTPSYTDSDISIGGANYFQLIKQEEPQLIEAEKQLKFEQFDDYSPLDSDEQPDDEELLDYISLWQEQ